LLLAKNDFRYRMTVVYYTRTVALLYFRWKTLGRTHLVSEEKAWMKAIIFVSNRPANAVIVVRCLTLINRSHIS